ncbi:signal peptide peptidase SppA [Nocardioides sp.]|uniref:signal peptide peptidase SppA n=1 Tax=Nocardioides sp. TaxID=35761 RepID=UPI003512CF80
MAKLLSPLLGDRARGPRTVLEIDLSQGVVINPPSTPWEALRLRQAPSLGALRRGLRRAATDDEVLGLLIHVGTCPLSLAEADEVGDLIEEFGRHKPTVAWTETFGEIGDGLAAYRVAVRAREIWVQPSGGLGLTGVALAVTLLRGGFDKLGVEPQFGQRHEYKSAADRFAASEITAPVREMTQRLADSIVEDTVALVARRRGVTTSAVEAAIAAAPLTPEAAREAGLVDHVGYYDDVRAAAREAWTPAWELRYAHRYAAATGRTAPAAQVVRRALPGHGTRTVGVVNVTGAIVLGPGNARQAGSERVCARLRALGRDDDVAAVLLRVDSPGGSYVASDSIRHEVLALREAGRPVVAQMGTVAASGGYFAAMGADEIIAQPTTITGSIGVLAGKFVLAGLLERLGIQRETMTSGPRAAMLAPERPFTDEERAVLDSWLDDVYADFTTKAAADRRQPLELLEPLARGRVWTGADAHARGLVDHLGGSRLAIDRVAALVGVPADRLRMRTPSPFDVLKQLRPVESSEAPGAVHAGGLWDALGLPASATAGSLGGPEAMISHWAERLGMPLPAGVLALPWDLRLG